MGHGAATEVTGPAGGDQKPVTPGAQPALFRIGNSVPELSLGSRSCVQNRSSMEQLGSDSDND